MSISKTLLGLSILLVLGAGFCVFNFFARWFVKQLEYLLKPNNYREGTVKVKIVADNLYFRTFKPVRISRIASNEYQPKAFHQCNYFIEGSLSIPSLDLKREFYYSTDPQGRRKTSLEQKGNRPAIALFGCSYTWGTGVKDEATFAWKLQEALPSHAIHNYGVGSFSLYEIMLSVENVLRENPSEIAVIVYHKGLEERSTAKYPGCSWSQAPRCLTIKLPWNSQRYLIRLPPQRLSHRIKQIKNLALKAFCHGILSWQIWPTNNPSMIRNTGRYLIERIKACSEANKTQLLFYCLDSSPPLLEFLTKNEIPFSQFCPHESRGNLAFLKGYSLYPFDPHYNEVAHELMAKELQVTISDLKNGCLHAQNIATQRQASQFDVFYPLF